MFRLLSLGLTADCNLLTQLRATILEFIGPAMGHSLRQGGTFIRLGKLSAVGLAGAEYYANTLPGTSTGILNAHGVNLHVDTLYGSLSSSGLLRMIQVGAFAGRTQICLR